MAILQVFCKFCAFSIFKPKAFLLELNFCLFDEAKRAYYSILSEVQISWSSLCFLFNLCQLRNVVHVHHNRYVAVISGGVFFCILLGRHVCVPAYIDFAICVYDIRIWGWWGVIFLIYTFLAHLLGQLSCGSGAGRRCTERPGRTRHNAICLFIIEIVKRNSSKDYRHLEKKKL